MSPQLKAAEKEGRQKDDDWLMGGRVTAMAKDDDDRAAKGRRKRKKCEKTRRVGDSSEASLCRQAEAHALQAGIMPRQ